MWDGGDTVWASVDQFSRRHSLVHLSPPSLKDYHKTHFAGGEAEDGSFQAVAKGGLWSGGWALHLKSSGKMGKPGVRSKKHQ